MTRFYLNVVENIILRAFLFQNDFKKFIITIKQAEDISSVALLWLSFFPSIVVYGFLRKKKEIRKKINKKEETQLIGNV